MRVRVSVALAAAIGLALALGRTSPQPRMAGLGSASVLRGGQPIDFVETRAQTVGGWVQTWRFDRAPRGTGPLEVQVETGPLQPLGEFPEGLRFRDEDGRVVSYGLASWVDAQGAKVAVVPRLRGGRVVLEVPEEVLARSSYPALLDPKVTADLIADPAVTYETLPEASSFVRTRFDGTNFITAWQDSRTGSSAIYVSALAPDAGVVLTGRTLLSEASGAQTSIGCAKGGAMYWAIQANGLLVQVTSPVTGAGFVPLAARSLSTGGSGFPQMSCDAVTPVVFAAQGSSLYAARVLPDAGLQPNGAGVLGAPLATAIENTAPYFSAAFDGTHFLLVWVDARNRAANALPDGGNNDPVDLYGRLINPDGTAAAAEFLVRGGAGSQLEPQVAFDGTSFLVVWSDRPVANAFRNIRGRVVSTAGVPGTEAAISGQVDDEFTPRVVFDGFHSIVAWQVPNGQIYSTQMVGLAPTLRLPVPSASALYDSMSLATMGGGVSFLAYSWWSLNRPHGMLLSGSTALTAPIPLVNAANEQRRPAIAKGMSEHFVFWHDGIDRVGGATVAPLGASPSTVFSAGTRFDELCGNCNTALAFGADQFLATWVQGSDVMGRRFNASLQPLGPVGFFSTRGKTAFTDSVARRDGGFLIVTQEDGINRFDVYGREVELDGGISQLFPLYESTLEKWSPHVAMNAAGTGLVVWSLRGQPITLGGVRFDGQTVLDAPALSLGSSDYLGGNDVASDGRDFLVVSSSNGEISGVFVHGQGNPDAGPPFFISNTAEQELRPSVAFDGKDFVVAWEGWGDGRGDIYLSKVSRDGGVGARVAVAADPTRAEGQPALSADSVGRWLVSFVRFDPALAVSARRVYLRWVVDDALGATCAVGSDCSSSFCSTGVCCATQCNGVCQTCDSDGVCATVPGCVDAGTDAGVDAGPDAGSTDAGELDAGPMDAGSADAGEPDAGTETGDAGLGPLTLRVGCGCTSTGSTGLAFLVAWVAVRRRRG
jgi:hypothetical protein